MTVVIQGDCYMVVNFAENVRQLKILGSCPVTVIQCERYIQVNFAENITQLKILGSCLE